MNYEWLRTEAAEVKWAKFFVFKRDAEHSVIAAVERRFGSLPNDYKEFLLEFGESRLFRSLDRGSYNMGVFSRPRVFDGLRGELLLESGYYINGGYAYFRKAKGAAMAGPEVFEGAGSQVRKAADSFDEWTKNRFRCAKRLYKKSDWARILEGARPFSAEELRIVEAIKLFSFERVGIAGDGNMQIRVQNNSDLRLPYLTVGARVPGRLIGEVFLDVSDVGPGETKIIEHDCYKSLAPADKVELYRKPPPEPEEREMFRELAGLAGHGI